MQGGLRSLLRFEIHFLKHTLSHSNFTSQQFWRGISSPWERARRVCLHGAGRAGRLGRAGVGWGGLGVFGQGAPGQWSFVKRMCKSCPVFHGLSMEGGYVMTWGAH